MQHDKNAEHYRGRPGDIDLSEVYELPIAPRSGGSTLAIPMNSRMPSRIPSTETSRAPSRNQGRYVVTCMAPKNYNSYPDAIFK